MATLVQKTVFFTNTTAGSLTLPDFYSFISVAAIGGGGNGTSATKAGAGGGGAYANSTSVTGITQSTPIYYSVGSASQDTWLNVVSNAAPTLSSQGVLAKGGSNSSTTTGGAGGAAASCVGDVTSSGGTGGGSNNAGAGGGGAGGPGGAGGTGGNSATAGGGGGGSGATFSVAGTNGTQGAAGASTGQTAGSAATVSLPANNTPPANGGGGGPGASTTNLAGGYGGAGTYWTSTHKLNAFGVIVPDVATAGSGGGAGGMGATGSTGGAGGLYGGGAGGGSTPGGGQGIIVLAYNSITVSISGISPSSDVDCGGRTAVITGLNFTGATSVTFGSASASFTVDSDTQITATVPAGFDALANDIGTGAVTVTVTTPYGSGTGTFTYNETQKFTNISYASTPTQIGELIYGLTADNAKLLADGYLIPNGSTISQSTYSSLYAVLGRFADGGLANAVAPTAAGIGGATSSTINSVVYGGGIFVGAGGAGILQTSTNGITWTARTSGTTSRIQSVTYNPNASVVNGAVYVFGGFSGAMATSTNGITWTQRTQGTTTINSVTYGNGIYVYGANGGALATSSDAITWTTRSLNAPGITLNSVIYAGGIYVLAGSNGYISTSTDAITWTNRTSGTATAISALTYGNSIYVYAGDSGVLASSTDAITWTARTSGTTSAIKGLGYGDAFVYGGAGSGTNGFVGYSKDGVTWSLNATTVGSGIYGNPIPFNSTSYNYIFGTRGDVYYGQLFTYDAINNFRLPSITNPLTANLGTANLYVKAL